MIKSVPVPCISILFIIFFQLQLSAQTDTFTSQDVGVLEEYTNPQVTSLYQDRRGLLWISTYGGMDRWDGKRMVHYPYMPFDSTGSVWMSHNLYGLCYYELKAKEGARKGTLYHVY